MFEGRGCEGVEREWDFWGEIGEGGSVEEGSLWDFVGNGEEAEKKEGKEACHGKGRQGGSKA